MDRSRLADEFEQLLNVGIALSSVHDLQKLLDLILLEARRLTRADAGTLYLVKGNRLIFRVSQCQSLSERLGEERMRQCTDDHSQSEHTDVACSRALRPG